MSACGSDVIDIDPDDEGNYCPECFRLALVDLNERLERIEAQVGGAGFGQHTEGN